MAEKWQQWMPWHIDRFKGSPAVQAMHPIARAGYLYLLGCQWQTDDCTISADPIDLADMSGLGDELWAAHAPRILRNFAVMHDGRLRNEVLFEEWHEAKKIYDDRQAHREELRRLRQEAGKNGANRRWASKEDSKPIANAITSDGKSMANDGYTGTVTVTGTEEQKQKEPPVATPVNRNLRGTDTATSGGATPKAFNALKAQLPEWVDAEAWKGFVEMRKIIKKPLTTERAFNGIISKLGKLRASGQDPGACLDQSTERNYPGVFPVNDGGFNGSQGNRTSNYQHRSKTAGNFDEARAALFALAGEEPDSPGDGATGKRIEGHADFVRQ